MALEQTAALRKTLLFHSNPRPVLPLPFLSINYKTLRKLASSSSIKCSFDYSGNTTAASSNDGLYEYERYAVTGPLYPRPAEIPWEKELCNFVQFIGIVGTPVQIKHLPSGKVMAWTRLGVKKSKTDAMWISLIFYDELAQAAFQHLEKGHQIYVSGRLIADTVENGDGKQPTYYKVVAKQLNFIERGFTAPSFNGDSNSVTTGQKQNYQSANSTGSIEELWQAFFANPLEWWDNRKNKRSPNYPDFKHKDTGEALWVDGRYNPPWVKSQLAILDSRMESYHDQNSSTRVNFMTVDSLF